MIRCETEAEKKALVDLVWAVKDVLCMGKRASVRPEIVTLSVAFDALCDATNPREAWVELTGMVSL